MEFRELRADEIDVRIAQIEKNWCTLLLYKDARVDMNILDETIGNLNWQKKYLRDNANCIVSIWDDDKKQWIEKEDTGTESFSEAEKGLASDSFKRACFNWGIGRELYTSPVIFVIPRKDIKYKNNGTAVDEFFEYKEGKYTTKTKFYVDYIDYDKKVITDLVIRDQKGNIRFELLKEETQDIMNKEILKLKKLVEALEDKDEDFDREVFYKGFNVNSDSQLNYKQKKTAISILETRLKNGS